MKAIMLAAGIGSRLAPSDENLLPKCLLKFEGKSLLSRHIQTLKSVGIEELTIVMGYQADKIESELKKIDRTGFVTTIINPDYLNGSIFSLYCARNTMQSGRDILFMDADVLYHPELIIRLISSKNDNHILYDRNYVPGDDPVLLCINNGKITDFRKRANAPCENIGEWPGFVKWSPTAARQISKIIDQWVSQGHVSLPCESAFREYMLNTKKKNIYCDDITGIPWIEIDFPEDLKRAQNFVLKSINRYTR